MLSGVKLVSKEDAARLEAKDKHDRKSKKHKKHSKKDKKDKRERRDRESSSSEPESPRCGLEGRSAQPPPTDHRPDDCGDGASPSQPVVQREDWMTVPMGRPFAAPPQEKEGTGEAKQDDGKPTVSVSILRPSPALLTPTQLQP